MKDKELLLSVTAKDCKFSFARGSGNGGQARNKSNNAVHCKHIESGAMGYSCDTRSASQNKAIAFKRMTETREFANWHTKKIVEIMGVCDPKDIKVEIGS